MSVLYVLPVWDVNDSGIYFCQKLTWAITGLRNTALKMCRQISSEVRTDNGSDRNRRTIGRGEGHRAELVIQKLDYVRFTTKRSSECSAIVFVPF
jgi:hypothetical protein